LVGLSGLAPLNAQAENLAIITSIAGPVDLNASECGLEAQTLRILQVSPAA
jgi:hypothetical protein